LSEKYVEEHPDEVFKTKTELAAEILEDSPAIGCQPFIKRA